MAAPSGVIVLWAGTNASIPTGWSRVTSLDGKYVRGASGGSDSDLSSSFGSATHTHTVVDHNHTQNSHTHTYSAGAGTGTTANTDGVGIVAQVNHTHASLASNSATATNQTASITLDGASNDPLYFEIIFIESDGTTDIPNDAIAFFDSATLPTNWDLCDGTGGIPNIANRFIKGASAGGNGGGTGGASTHTHANTAHNHTQDVHSHTAKNSSGPTGTAALTDSLRGTTIARSNHVHSVSLSNATATNQTASITMSAEDHSPSWLKLALIQNNTGASETPDDIIAIWGGTEASIPTDWTRLATMDTKFVKCVSDTSEIGDTGGSATHSHTADAHTHTQDTHNHGSSAGGSSANTGLTAGASNASSNTHTHTWTIGNTVATNQTTVVTINANSSESAYPPYQKVIFIKFAAPAGSTAVPPLKMQIGYGI